MLHIAQAQGTLAGNTSNQDQRAAGQPKPHAVKLLAIAVWRGVENAKNLRGTHEPHGQQSFVAYICICTSTTGRIKGCHLFEFAVVIRGYRRDFAQLDSTIISKILSKIQAYKMKEITAFATAIILCACSK